MKNRTVIAVTAAALLLGSGPAIGAGTVVARVKVQNPAGEELKDVIIRGMLPLPADHGRPVTALALRDGEEVLPTQVSVFSTYPGSDDAHPVGRPEVVQMVTRASLPAKTFKELAVVALDAAPRAVPAPRPGKAVAAWLAGKAPLLVEATDCFGSRYRAAALDESALIETRQSGPLLSERVYQSILTPVAKTTADSPALKKLLRVRAYLTLYDGEEFASLALMIHNGSIDRPNGNIYYGQIRVGIAEPMAMAVWQKRFSPAAEGEQTAAGGFTWQPCPPPHPGGKVFVMPHGAAAVLRTTVYARPAGKRALLLAEHSPIFVPVPSEKHWSWSNFATARYDSTKYPMPLDLGRDALANVERDVKRKLASPSLGWDLVYLWQKPRPSYRTLGHAMPAGVQYGGMTGGAGINYVFGVRAALTGHNGLIKLHVLLADRNFDRHHMHLFYDDGRAYTHGRHVVEADGRKYLDVVYDNRGFPVLQVADPACAAHARHVKDKGLLAPRAARLLKYMNHDDQHLSRVFDAVPAAYLACDPVNRDRLVTLGGRACWKLNIHPIRNRPRFGGWGSLFGAKNHVDAHPHEGFGASREYGWVTHTLGWGHDLSLDRQVRADCIEVAKADVQVRRKAQMPAGNVTIRGPSGKALKREYWFTTGWEEGGILADGARAVVNILSSPANAADAEALKAVYARVGRWTVTAAWNDKAKSPGFHVGLRKKGTKVLLARPVTSGGCAFYMGTPLAWYHELTGEKVFLDRLREMAGESTLAQRCRRNLGNWSYALYLAQGGRVAGRTPLTPQQ